MLIHQPDIHAQLVFIARSVSSDQSLQDDLKQEALIHLWQCEMCCPGRTHCWYFQSCRFHLRNYIRQGRSVDAYRRSHLRCRVPEEAETSPEVWIDYGPDPVSLASTADIIEQLVARIVDPARQILFHLIAGAAVPEIARRIGISRQAVNTHRRKIANLARRLGVRR